MKPTLKYQSLYVWLFKALMGLVLLATLAGNGGMLLKLNQPWGGFFAQWHQEIRAYRIIPGNNPAAPGLRNGAILPGDTILGIAEGNLKQHGLYQIYTILYYEGRRELTYILDRDGKIVRAVGPLLLFTFHDILDQQFPYLLMGFLAWILAWIVFSTAPEQESNRAFAMFSLSASAVMMGGNYEFKGPWHIVGVMITMFTMIAFWPLIGASLLHFASVFPYPSARFGKWGQWAYLPALPAVILYEYATWHVTRSTAVYAAIDRVIFSFSGFMAIGGMLFLLIRCFSVILHPCTNTKERRQTQLALLGFVIGVAFPTIPYALYTISPRWYYPVRLLNYPLVGAFFFLSLGYAILRYQMFQSRRRILSTLVMLGICVLLAQLMLATTSFVWKEVPRGYSWTLAQIIVVSMITTPFWQGHHAIANVLNRLLNRHHNQYATLSKFIQRDIEITSENTLIERFLEILCTEFDARYVSCWRCTANGEFSAPLIHFSIYFAGTEKEITFPVAVASVVRVPDPLDAAACEAILFPLYDPLRQEHQLLGLVLLGGRWTEELYDEDDLKLLRLIGEYFTSVILTTRYAAHLREEPLRILAAQEYERERLAQELHDTVQQGLSSLPFYLDAIQFNMGNVETANILFTRCYDLISQIAVELRDIRYNLASVELRTYNLSDALQKLLDRLILHTNLEVTLHCTHVSNLTELQTRTIYRIIQQAVTNVVQHAAASKVEIVLWQAGEEIRLHIEDDGQGFEVQDFDVFRHTGHEGLAGMRDRISVLRGRLRIDSCLHQGTKLAVSLPLHDKSFDVS